MRGRCRNCQSSEGGGARLGRKEEWQKNIFAAALERTKPQVDERQFQIFDSYVLKEWPVAEVARVSEARVYRAKHSSAVSFFFISTLNVQLSRSKLPQVHNFHDIVAHGDA